MCISSPVYFDRVLLEWFQFNGFRQKQGSYDSDYGVTDHVTSVNQFEKRLSQ